MLPKAGSIVWKSGADLAEAVLSARRARGWTQAELGRRARVGLKFIYQLERGKETLRVDKALEVLDVLGLTLIVMPARKGVRTLFPTSYAQLREKGS